MADQPEQKRDRRPVILAGLVLFFIGGGIITFAYLSVANKSVYIDKAQIEAPVATLSPRVAGVLQHVYVTEGQIIPPNTVVAQVGVELIKSTAGGLVLSARTDLGSVVTPQTAVVTTADPQALRVVGELQEDKGLADIRVGEPATFSVDAFGGKTFSGVVEEISPTSNKGDIVFSISDKRQEQTFDVKVAYDTSAHPELRNGMSAKIWVYKR